MPQHLTYKDEDKLMMALRKMPHPEEARSAVSKDAQLFSKACRQGAGNGGRPNDDDHFCEPPFALGAFAGAVVEADRPTRFLRAAAEGHDLSLLDEGDHRRLVGGA